MPPYALRNGEARGFRLAILLVDSSDSPDVAGEGGSVNKTDWSIEVSRRSVFSQAISSVAARIRGRLSVQLFRQRFSLFLFTASKHARLAGNRRKRPAERAGTGLVKHVRPNGRAAASPLKYTLFIQFPKRQHRSFVLRSFRSV